MSKLEYERNKNSFIERKLNSRSSIEAFKSAYKALEACVLQNYGMSLEEKLEKLKKVKSEPEIWDFLQGFVSYLKAKGLTAVSIRSSFKRIKPYVAYRLEFKIHSEDVKTEVKFPKKQKNKRHGLSTNEIKKILDYASPQRKALYLTLLSSGMRIQESVQLRKRDFDTTLERWKINLRASYTKNKVERITFISKEASDYNTTIDPTGTTAVSSFTKASGALNTTLSQQPALFQKSANALDDYLSKVEQSQGKLARWVETAAIINGLQFDTKPIDPNLPPPAHLKKNDINLALSNPKLFRENIIKTIQKGIAVSQKNLLRLGIGGAADTAIRNRLVDQILERDSGQLGTMLADFFGKEKRGVGTPQHILERISEEKASSLSREGLTDKFWQQIVRAGETGGNRGLANPFLSFKRDEMARIRAGGFSDNFSDISAAIRSGIIKQYELRRLSPEEARDIVSQRILAKKVVEIMRSRDLQNILEHNRRMEAMSTGVVN